MDRNFIETPWGEDAYICIKCKAETFRLFEYCPRCGTKNDVEKSLNLEAYHPAIVNTEEIKSTLEKLKGHNMRLWDYCVSHCVLQIRVAHCPPNSKNSENRKNSIIYCSGTEKVNISTFDWYADLTLEIDQKGIGKVCRLIDEKADVYIQCANIGIYENMPARYFDSPPRNIK